MVWSTRNDTPHSHVAAVGETFPNVAARASLAWIKGAVSAAAWRAMAMARSCLIPPGGGEDDGYSAAWRPSGPAACCHADPVQVHVSPYRPPGLVAATPPTRTS